jgi:hypothetical protein
MYSGFWQGLLQRHEGGPELDDGGVSRLGEADASIYGPDTFHSFYEILSLKNSLSSTLATVKQCHENISHI